MSTLTDVATDLPYELAGATSLISPSTPTPFDRE